jgi:hypothetical protein
MTRPILAGGRPLKRSQIREARRSGRTIKTGFARNTDPKTGKLIKTRSKPAK